MIASVGYGHLTPQTYSEFVVSIVLMILGVIFFGYIIASVTASFVNADINRAAFNERIKMLGKQMKFEMVPPQLQQKVLKHVQYEFFRSQGIQAHMLFKNLPPSIRGDVALVLFEDLISAVPIFATIDRNFHRMLSMCLKEAFFLEGETVIFKGDIGQEMYFIHRGVCAILDDDGNSVITLEPGRFFGEVSVMFSIPRTVSIKAKTNADLFVLTRNDLHDVMENYPDIKREIERIAIERLQAGQHQHSSVGASSSRQTSSIYHRLGSQQMDSHQGRKHKTHRRRTMVDQLSSAMHFQSHSPRKNSRINRENVTIPEKKQVNTQQNQQSIGKQYSAIMQLLQAMSHRAHNWFSKHSREDVDLDSSPRIITSHRKTERQSEVENVNSQLQSSDSAKRVLSQTLQNPALPRLMIDSAGGSRLNLKSEENHGKVLLDNNLFVEKSPSSMSDYSTSHLSLKPLESFSAHHEIREVYVSSQSIAAESQTSVDIMQTVSESKGLDIFQVIPTSSKTSTKSASDTRELEIDVRRKFKAPSFFTAAHEYACALLAKIFPSEFVLVPESTILFLFNLILAVFGAASIILMFYLVAFLDSSSGTDEFFYFCTALYMLNIFIRMHTAYYDHYGDLVNDYTTVRRVYMHRPTGFLVDLVSALPVGLLAFISVNNVMLRRTIAILRFVQMARMYKAYDLFRTWERRLNAPILLLRCIRDVGMLLILLHLCSCFWYMLSCPYNVCKETSWVRDRNLVIADHLECYINAIYFITATMTSAGYGDIVPTTMPEVLYTILMIIIGKFALGLAIGDLASTLSNLELARVEMETTLGIIVNQMKDQTVPAHLKQRVVQHIKYDWCRNGGHSLRQLLEHLPHCLKMEVYEAMYTEQLRSISIFEQAPDYMIRRLSCMCEQQVFLPGDFITKRGDIGHKVYVMRRGSVQVYTYSPEQPDYYLYSGAIYGDLQIVYPMIPYQHNLMADYPSDVLVIDQHELQLLLADNPHYYYKVRQYIQKKYVSLIQDRKPSMR